MKLLIDRPVSELSPLPKLLSWQKELVVLLDETKDEEDRDNLFFEMTLVSGWIDQRLDGTGDTKV